jgi:hypothetical protein
MAVECSPGRKPGVRILIDISSPRRGRQKSWPAKTSVAPTGLYAYLRRKPRAHAPGYTVRSPRELVESALPRCVVRTKSRRGIILRAIHLSYHQFRKQSTLNKRQSAG